MTKWLPTRAEGLRRLEDFLPRAGRTYARLRNYDRGPGRHDDVSCLSPWIRHRLITEQEVVAAVLAAQGFSAAEKFIQEVFWRTYWKGWLELRPGVWSDYRKRVRDLVAESERNAALRESWQVAMAGRTGIACFDAWAQELVDTGYLHNHARMWFASIWIFTLELPWELGADFFLRHLLDGDPASNTLSWRWVGGLQTRGKTYLARPDNIERYTEGRFRPRGALAPRARALEGPPPPASRALPPQALRDRTLRTALLLTEEDLHPDFLLDEDAQVRGILAVRATAQRSPLPVATLVETFVEGAIADSLRRLQDRTGAPADKIGCEDPVPAIVRWARDSGLQQIVTSYLPVGPTSEALSGLAKALAQGGVALVSRQREWDRLSWPHATRGFFPFREKIPALLRRLGESAARAA